MSKNNKQNVKTHLTQYFTDLWQKKPTIEYIACPHSRNNYRK